MRVKLIIAVLGAGAMLSGCVSTYTSPVAVLSTGEQAGRCVRKTDGKKAPQIMTYDSDSRTETHASNEGDEYKYSVQNKPQRTAVGVKGGTDKGADFDVCREDGY
ncbi:hypothetical protein [Asticcacaulis endophyticus]|nr:hypothetical protein [Asticcacaulis endophyticus]